MFRLLASIGVIALAVAIAGGFFFYGGFFDVAANGDEENPLIARQIAQVRMASIRRHATDRAPVDFGDPARTRAGAALFARQGCANCHGAPGAKWMKFAEGMNPSPPELKEAAEDMSSSEIFWVVKHGIRMTGMPSFASAGVQDDDIWSIVAFVKKIADVPEADYRSWTAQPAPAQDAQGKP